MRREALDIFPELAVWTVDQVNSVTPPARVSALNEENILSFPALGGSFQPSVLQSATGL